MVPNFNVVDPSAARFFVWLWVTAVPCAVFGLLLAYAGMHFDGVRTRRARLVLGFLTACLIVSTGVTTARVYGAVIYDICQDPAVQNSWTWWMWCFLR